MKTNAQGPAIMGNSGLWGERIATEQEALAEDVEDIHTEAKGQGFAPPILRKLIALRKKDPAKRREEEELLDLYIAAVGVPE